LKGVQPDLTRGKKRQACQSGLFFGLFDKC
jgi:hypothetical protein